MHRNFKPKRDNPKDGKLQLVTTLNPLELFYAILYNFTQLHHITYNIQFSFKTRNTIENSI